MKNDARAFLGGTAASLLLVLVGPLGRRFEMIGSDDLSRIWAGPRAFLTGADPYDPASYAATATALGTQPPDTAVYIYPPWVLLPLVPISALDLRTFSVVWLVASVLVGALALWALLRTFVWGRTWIFAVAPAVLFLSWTSALNLVIGQWGYFLVGALAACVLALRADRPVRAGVAALASLIKPQLFVLAAPALAVHALWPRLGRAPDRRGVAFCITALGIGLALVAISWAVLPQWWPAYPTHVAARQLHPSSDTLSSFLAQFLGERGGVLVGYVAFAGVVAAGLAFHPRSPAWVPVWLALSLAGAPYTNSYDQMLLIVPLVVAAGVALRWSQRASDLLFGAGALVLLAGTPLFYAIAVMRRSETYGVLIPLAMAALIVVALWPVRRLRDP